MDAVLSAPDQHNLATQNRASQEPKGRKGRSELAAPLDPLAFRAHHAVQLQEGGKLVRLDQVKDKVVQWLVPDLIPLGSITVCDGPKAEGKSTLMYDLAARLTAGKPMPFCNGDPLAGGAILLQAEDDLGATVKQSVLAAGGAHRQDSRLQQAGYVPPR